MTELPTLGKKQIIIGIVVLVIVGISIGVAIFFLKSKCPTGYQYDEINKKCVIVCPTGKFRNPDDITQCIDCSSDDLILTGDGICCKKGQFSCGGNCYDDPSNFECINGVTVCNKQLKCGPNLCCNNGYCMTGPTGPNLDSLRYMCLSGCPNDDKMKSCDDGICCNIQNGGKCIIGDSGSSFCCPKDKLYLDSSGKEKCCESGHLCPDPVSGNHYCCDADEDCINGKCRTKCCDNNGRCDVYKVINSSTDPKEWSFETTTSQLYCDKSKGEECIVFDCGRDNPCGFCNVKSKCQQSIGDIVYNPATYTDGTTIVSPCKDAMGFDYTCGNSGSVSLSRTAQIKNFDPNSCNITDCIQKLSACGVDKITYDPLETDPNQRCQATYNCQELLNCPNNSFCSNCPYTGDLKSKCIFDNGGKYTGKMCPEDTFFTNKTNNGTGISRCVSGFDYRPNYGNGAEGDTEGHNKDDDPKGFSDDYVNAYYPCFPVDQEYLSVWKTAGKSYDGTRTIKGGNDAWDICKAKASNGEGCAAVNTFGRDENHNMCSSLLNGPTYSSNTFPDISSKTCKIKDNEACNPASSRSQCGGNSFCNVSVLYPECPDERIYPLSSTYCHACAGTCTPADHNYVFLTDQYNIDTNPNTGPFKDNYTCNDSDKRVIVPTGNMPTWGTFYAPYTGQMPDLSIYDDGKGGYGHIDNSLANGYNPNGGSGGPAIDINSGSYCQNEDSGRCNGRTYGKCCMKGQEVMYGCATSI